MHTMHMIVRGVGVAFQQNQLSVPRILVIFTLSIRVRLLQVASAV